MDSLILGVDGGQTSTKCVLMRADGRVLGHGKGAGLIHLAAEGGPERMRMALRGCISTAFADAGFEARPLDAIGLGLTGISSAEAPEAKTVRTLVAETFIPRIVVVENDAYTALLGAHAGGPGVVAISGTGSIVCGTNARGELQRAGGWGWLLGDEGSGLWIGRSGLMAALRAVDEIGPPTALVGRFLSHFEISDMLAIKPRVYRSDFGAKGFAALAALVSDAARDGDTVAQGVIATGGGALAELVSAVVRRLGSEAGLPVAPVGGAFEHVHGLRDAFTRELARLAPGCTVVDAQAPPMHGAALMARRAARVFAQAGPQSA
jgi:N-acetylglucosamine kinase-like BadF-type ATPase